MGVIFDVSDRLLYPLNHPSMITTTASFFVMIATVYALYYSIRRPD
jgi:hypothetical protein